MFLIAPLLFASIALLLAKLAKPKFGFMVGISPYLFFSIAPVLTYFEVIGVLSGFDGGGSSLLTFGLTFYTVYVAYQLSKYKNEMLKTPYKFIICVCNPLYFFTGPIPNKFGFSTKNYSFKRILKLSSVLSGEIGVGLFFATILAPSFSTLFYLKDSLNTIDIIIFGFIFEFFVYFNFAGYSMIAWSLMRIAGFNVPKNFKHPFAAISIIDYWQRWHISLSQILKELFFVKIKSKIGLYLSVFVVFFASSLWHGVTQNFVFWGFFHATIWCFSHYISKYKKIAFINYLLFIFAVVVGRIIFSEMDFSVLLSKLESIFTISKWNSDSVGVFIASKRDFLNLIIASVIILWEILSARFSSADSDYSYLKKPVTSTLIVFYVCITFIGFGVTPIYGER
jgi:D-alanyl-lipoteichoic acid acyltransferase DltB (MBOAT superfamily)